MEAEFGPIATARRVFRHPQRRRHYYAPASDVPGRARGGRPISGELTPTERRHLTDLLSDRAAIHRRPHAKPFFLSLQHTAPHAPGGSRMRRRPRPRTRPDDHGGRERSDGHGAEHGCRIGRTQGADRAVERDTLVSSRRQRRRAVFVHRAVHQRYCQGGTRVPAMALAGA
jgi:hypothetical protein